MTSHRAPDATATPEAMAAPAATAATDALTGWHYVNRQLVAKSIGELSYEQILLPKVIETPAEGYALRGEAQSAASINERIPYISYELRLQSGVIYFFEAWRSVWDHLRVRPESVLRVVEGSKISLLSAGQFFIDSQSETGMTDIILGNFLEEMQSTLFSDLKLLEKTAELSAQQIATWSGEKVQGVLNGHPKLLLNKGRMGWGKADLEAYSPESSAGFRLHWLALQKDKCTFGFQAGLSESELLEGSLNPTQIEAFESKIIELGREPGLYFLIPVHPWQWDRILQIQFVGELAQKEILSLGEAGDVYRPQISLRTLANSSRPLKSDIKLPLTILNTSAVRGIPGRYIATAPRVADALSRICATDPVLKMRGTEVLAEQAGISFRQNHFAQVKAAPYRYHETLGVIWRESVESKLTSSDELGVMTGSLFHQDFAGRSLIGAYIERSDISKEEWLERYFDVVVIPLYHLQLKYGLGLVAHGQNVVLKMKSFIPCGVFLKDFQGDLRASSEAPTLEISRDAIENLDKLPPEYLIHDLLTGHFLTVLRFISEVLVESDGFAEEIFYGILAGSLERYLHSQGLDSELDSRLNLLSAHVHRVLLNKVRFKIGYADLSARPLPMLGEDLLNPLVASRKSRNAANMISLQKASDKNTQVGDSK